MLNTSGRPELLEVVSTNANPEKPRSRIRIGSHVSRYCPTCKSNTWIMVNVGDADVISGKKPQKVRCCVHCLASGRVTTW
jgi:hypothetical protein